MLELVLALALSQAPAYAPGTGVCPTGQFVTAVNKGRPPSCAASAGGGAPTTAPYVTTAADAGLSAEVVLPTCGGTDKLTFNGTAISCAADVGGSASPGGSSGNLQTNNGAGGFGAYAGASCVAGTFPSVQSSSGAWTCAAPPAQDWSVITGKPATFPATLPVGTATALAADPAACTGSNWVKDLAADGTLTCTQVGLSNLANPTADIEWAFTGEKVLWDFQSPVDSGFSIHGTEAFLGDLVHIHQHSGNPTAGTDLLHIEATDPDVVGLKIVMANSAHQAATITGAVGVTGAVTASSFAGPITGAVTGNASTATALAADGADCVGVGEFAKGTTAAGVASGCAVPPGTYTLPAASTTLGGVKMAAACGAGNHVSSIGAGGELGCTADSGGSLAAATATVLGGLKGNGTTTACSGTDKMTGWDAAGALTCAADQTGGAGSVDLRGLVTTFGGF